MAKILIVVLAFLVGIINIVKSDNDVNVNYFRVTSDIQTRFATTLITSRLANPSNDAKEVIFTVQLPDAAFISNFSMEIGQKILVGEVKKKEQAKAAYEEAKRRNESTGLAAQRATNMFTISTNVAANDNITFNLTYQEILKRVHGVYKHIINLYSDKLLASSEVEIEVRIRERGKIINVKVPKFGPKIGEKTNRELFIAEQEPSAKISFEQVGSVTTYRITYKPELPSNGTLQGQLVVLYDLERDETAGEIQVVNGYFVHFFAPKGLASGKKHVAFVLDKSGSMSGQKFKQTQEAMKKILTDLDPSDVFNIIMFSTDFQRWQTESVIANKENVKVATDYVKKSTADGSTNIYDSLEDAINLLKSMQPRDSNRSVLTSMIIFMTDGQPNVGKFTSDDDIVKGITKLNHDTKYLIHSIAFGKDAVFSLMQQISAKNYGLARKVYEDLDADLQLQGFYSEISSPLLTDVKFVYLNETVDIGTLVQDQSNTYYDGGELVVLGKVKEGSSKSRDFNASVSARGDSGPFNLESRAQDPVYGSQTLGGFVERMWAYQTIKKLLKEVELEGNSTEKHQQALKLSLKYNFVTALTSMVVVQPDKNDTALLPGFPRGSDKDLTEDKKIDPPAGGGDKPTDAGNPPPDSGTPSADRSVPGLRLDGDGKPSGSGPTNVLTHIINCLFYAYITMQFFI